MHNISNMLVFVGLCVMLLSIFISLKINKIVGQEKKQKWAILTSLMVFFLIGYGTFFFIQFKNFDPLKKNTPEEGSEVKLSEVLFENGILLIKFD